MNSETKNAIVTGGGSGIGHSISLKLAAQGFNVFVADLNFETARNTTKTIKSNGGKAEAMQLDVSNHNAVLESFRGISSRASIDILVNNAGVGSVGTIEQTDEAEMDRLYAINVKGVYNCALAAIPVMKKQQSGLVINMASIASSVGIPDRFAYSMSKGAVLTMTYSIARDYVEHNIRCNSIAPGRVHTPFVDAYLEKNYPDNKAEMYEMLSKTQPVGRMGKPEEIAALVGYLCSPEATFITGTNFPIDGGFVTINN